MRIQCLCGLFGMLLAGLPLSLAWGGVAEREKLCAKSFQKKSYQQAARCFRDLVRETGIPEDDGRFRVGGWIRHGALSLRKAAERETDVARAALLREEALEMLKRYLEKRLYRTPTQRQLAETMKTQLFGEIGYSDLTVVSNHLKATIRVLGLKFTKVGQGTLTVKARPGTYTVLVIYPGKPQTAKTVNMSASQPQVVTFVPPGGLPPTNEDSSKKGSRLAVIPGMMVGIGLLAAAGGGGLLVWSRVTASERDDMRADALKTGDPIKTRKTAELHQTALERQNIGFVLIGAGSGLALIGLIWLAVMPGSSTKPLRRLRGELAPSGPVIGKLTQGEFFGSFQ